MKNKYTNHYNRRRRVDGSILHALFWPMLIVALLVGTTVTSDGGNAAEGFGAALATLPFFAAKPIIQDRFEDGGSAGGGSVSFEEKVLGKLDAAQKAFDDHTAKVENLEKDTKSAIDELTKAKTGFEGLGSQVKEVQTAIQKVQLQMANERRNAFGNPIERIAGDPEKRAQVNALVRAACRRGLTPEMRTTLGEDSSPGSTTINDDLASDIYDTLAMYGVWNTFGVRRLGTKVTKFPVKTARATAAFLLTEGGAIGEDSAKAGTSVSLEVEVIASLLPVSMQLLDDSEFDVTADVLSDFAQSAAYRLDWAALAADGGSDATDGGMTGVFVGGTTAAAASGNTTVETTDFEDWTKCLLTVDEAVLNRGCKWWLNPQIVVRALSVKDSNGRPIFLTANEAPTRGGIGSILGYPVVLAHAAPKTNAADAKVAVFGDPEGQVVGVRKDFSFEASDDAGFTTYERYFRGIVRAGVKIRRAAAFAVLTLPSS